MTECNQSSFGFEGSGRREIVARFDGGTISSDGGAFLLRQVDKRLNLLTRFGQCFLDGRKQSLVEHSIPEMVSQRVYGLALGYETSTITSNCGQTRCSAFWPGSRTWPNRWRAKAR